MFQPPDLIPAPCSCLPGTGKFRITSSTQIHIGNKAATASAELLQQTLVQEMGIELRLDSAAVVKGSALVLQLRSDRNLPVEGYQLTVLPEAVTLRASDPRGLARGVQSLRQLLLLSAKPELASLQIQDHPRYPYRGMHLDVSRHFYSKEFILKYIDLLALYGFNTFHWHLVDDNGWRIEINRYPLLTEIGSRRADRTGIHWLERAPRQPGEATTYGGFYTQTEVREIVAYAQQRQITIIPEIEMPGHTMAALAAYPEYSCTGGPFEVCTGAYWPVTDIFCAGNDSTFTFLEHILLEVMELFPGEYIHIGGDEADKTEWKRCPRCQARMAEEGLKDEAGLQSWFTGRIGQFLSSHQRRLIGWDEILEGGLPPQATVMSWRSMQGGVKAARAGFDVVMTPVSHCYFDYYQADPKFEPVAIGGYLPLKQVYAFEPTPPELDEYAAAHILGGQGNMWSEYMPDTRQVEYMLLPRMCALAEVLWSPVEVRDWENFQQRLPTHLQLFERMGLNYFRDRNRVVS